MKYLFYIARKYSIPIIKPLISYLKNTADDFCLFVSQKVFNELSEEWKEYKIYRNIYEAIEYNPDFAIAPGNFIDFRIPGIKVQIFHGLGVEKQSHYKIRHFFDVYLTSGPYVTERFNILQKKHKYFLVEETGWPKIDHILQYPTANLKEKLNIPLDKNIILYAPTFSSGMQSASDLFPIIPKIIQKNEFWLIKFHDLMDKEVIKNFKNQRLENVLVIDSYDITPYLHVSDVMISDTSSVIYEFMVLDKPIITYRTQSRVDKGINITDPEETRTAIDRCLANPEEFHENRIKHLEEINPYLDGKICENIFTKLEDINNNNKLPQKRKPLNLFRKMQVIYHSIFKKGYIR